MPLRSSMLSFRSLGVSRFKSKKAAKTPVKTAINSSIMDRRHLPQPLPHKAYDTIHRLHNFDELVKRLNTVFLLYQVPLSEGRPIVFDEFRCNHALNLRLLLSIKASDLLESDRMASNFELHDLGLRLPENPLSVNPMCDYNTKIRKAFKDELGTVFINTSLEVLGLITVLHVLERAISWLEPLLSSEGIRRVQINIASALQSFSVPLQLAVNPSNTEGSLDQKRLVDSSVDSFVAISRKRFEDLHKQAFNTSMHNTVSSPAASRNLRDDIELRPEFSAYNFDKELPTDALDRWVLEARSHGHEPTLIECTQKFDRLKIDYQMYGHGKGYPPPPVSARYGYIDHALRRHYPESRAADHMSRTRLPLRPVQQQIAIRQEAEMLVAAATTFPHCATPQERCKTTANTPQVSMIGNPSLNYSRSNFALPMTQKSTQLAKTPRRRLAFTGSPIKRKNNVQIKIGIPSKFTHKASGTGLKSWDEMSRAMEAANKQTSHPARSDSIPDNLHSYAQASHDKSTKSQAKTLRPSITARRYTSNVHNLSPAHNTAFGRAVVTETAEKHRRHTTNVSHYSTPAKASSSKLVGAEATAQSEEQFCSSLEDQNAKVEALLTQLLLMQDVFRKARESLATCVGSQLIEKATDIAVAYGWFRANFEGCDRRQN